MVPNLELRLLNFTNTAQSGDPDIWQATFTIDTKADDGIDAANGEIEVKLDTPAELAGYTVKVDPDDHVDITIIDATKPLITMGDTSDVGSWEYLNPGFKFRALFNLVSDTLPHNSGMLDIKYQTKLKLATFLIQRQLKMKNVLHKLHLQLLTHKQVLQPFLGTIEILFEDEQGEESSDVTVTLLESDDYAISSQADERSETITVSDPSYIEVNSYGYGGSAATLVRDPDTNAAEEVVLYVHDPSANFEVTNISRVLRRRD